jgi:hypothetical protein
MKHTIRIITAAIVLSFVAACADKAQPPVKATPGDGKTYKPHGK